MIVVGVDGCSAGWVAAEWNTRKKSVLLLTATDFAEILAAYPESRAKAIAIDIPIGLVDGKRSCDVEARAALDCAKRKSSVFTAPYASLVHEVDYSNANNRSKAEFQVGIAAQAFGIFSKTAQVNDVMTPDLQDRVIEVHPEICFWAMNGMSAIRPPKRTGAGHRERLELLKSNLDLPPSAWETIESGIEGAKPDDVLDAVAAAWTARRWVNKSFGRFPATEQRNARGLRAEIVY